MGPINMRQVLEHMALAAMVVASSCHRLFRYVKGIRYSISRPLAGNHEVALLFDTSVALNSAAEG